METLSLIGKMLVCFSLILFVVVCYYEGKIEKLQKKF